MLVKVWTDDYAPTMVQVQPVSLKVLARTHKDAQVKGLVWKEDSILITWDEFRETFRREVVMDVERGWSARARVSDDFILLRLVMEV